MGQAVTTLKPGMTVTRRSGILTTDREDKNGKRIRQTMIGTVIYVHPEGRFHEVWPDHPGIVLWGCAMSKRQRKRKQPASKTAWCLLHKRYMNDVYIHKRGCYATVQTPVLDSEGGGQSWKSTK